MEKLNYGNWIRKKILAILGLSTVCLGLLTIFLPHPLVRVPMGIVTVVLFVSFLFPLYAYYQFSPSGGNLQEKFYDLIVSKIGHSITGRALDIGTGNGILAIKVAYAHPQVNVIGLDYWGKNWEYSQSVCLENANRAGVSGRVNFIRGDAAHLDYPDDLFDAVVSNLTFHEVKSAHDKREVAQEALRVLKPGGVFAFVDYFWAGRYYGRPEDFEAFLRNTGLSEIRMEHVKNVVKIPRPLLHPKALGKVGIVYGRKRMPAGQ